jgi:broad specificity phosphatase PhoE
LKASPALLKTPELRSEAINATRLWLIRHAEVELRYQGIFGGRIDMDLSPKGHEQAQALAQYLHRIRFDVLYASPMRRVQHTMAPFTTTGNVRPVVLQELREVDFGVWTGLAWGEVNERYGIHPSQWLEQLEAGLIPQAECARTLRLRVEPCLQQILRKHPGEQVGIFCHGGVIRMILAILLELPLPKMGAFEIEYASLTQIDLLPQKAEIRLLNFTPWRDV